MSLTTRTSLSISTGLLTLILGLMQAVMPLSIDLYLPGLPTIARDLSVSSGAAQATLAVFLIGVALGQITYGPLTDKYGRKPPLLAGLTIFVLGGVLCALAPSITVLIAGRFLQALGASASAVITAAVVRDLWSGKALADRLSILMLIMGVAPILAPSLGGLILTHVGWHGLFWLLALFGVLMLVTVTMLPETSSAQERADTRLRDAATNYLALLRNTPFMLYVLAGACMAGVLFAYLTGSSFMYIGTLGVSPGLFAVLFGVNAAGLILASQVNRALLRRFELYAVVRAAVLAAVVMAALLLAVVTSGQISVWTLTPVLFLLLASIGFIFPNLAALAFGNVRERMGSASALQGTTQSAIGATAGGLVSGLSDGTVLPVAGIISLFAVLSAVFLLAARRAQPKD
ncbi:multidrug effflux MFS transporter (plasmid) [Deinococcus taeanensis]|uniref:multidrug effflux MFS transporter n=1 Tax=Deinococcus taeanensis TaxID=2737050 RepID=UPI001CDCB9EE|nr:multidrug effflux MFS transporter [Deinococcus taeanensis]UBV45374.1 multidrug effflux MFS transporter [Deinococcus taeanensis]